MGALSQTLPEPTPKVRSLARRLLNSKGYTPVPMQVTLQKARIASGGAFHALMDILLALSLGRIPEKGKDRLTETLPVSVTELAEFAACDERTVERELKGMVQRSIATVSRPQRGTVIVTLLLANWRNVRKWEPPAPVDISTGKPEDTEEGEEEANKAAGYQLLTRKPITVRAGRSHKPFLVNIGVKNFQPKVDGPLDLVISAVIQEGSLIVTGRVSDEALRRAVRSTERNQQVNPSYPAMHGAETANVKRKQIKSERSSREGKEGPIDENRMPRAAGAEPTNRRRHPRADELSRLFDPFLLRSCQKCLSADSVALQQACEQLGAIPNEYLVKFVIERAARPINSPKHCRKIIEEARICWEKTGSLPVEQRIPPQSARKKGFVERLQETAAKNFKRYGTI